MNRIGLSLLIGASMLVVSPSVRATDWAYWRGPNLSGYAPERAVVTSFSQGGENLLWRSEASGRTTPIVMNNRVYGNAPFGSGESLHEWVYCLDADTGQLLWEHHFNVFHSTIVENRVGWTSMVGDPETGAVYVHGTGGQFICFDGATGDVIWEVSLTEMFGRISGYGGRINTPLIDEDRVVLGINSSSWGKQARPTHRYVNFDKKTGVVVGWFEPGGAPLDTTYSCPVPAVINGRRMLVGANADGNIYGMLARTGEKVWTFKFSKRGLNSSVVVQGNYVYASHGEENLDTTAMGRVVCIDASKEGDITKTGEVWRYDELKAGFASLAVANNRLYVVDNSANLFCLDAGTGNEHWRYKLGRVGKGSPVITEDGVIYVAELNGRFHILRDAGDKCEVLDIEVFEAEDGSVVEIYGSPAVAGGRVYFMNRLGTFCLGKRDAKVPEVKIAAEPQEKLVKPFRPGALRIVPAEATLSPGQSLKLVARLFDENGSSYDTPEATWSVQGVNGSFGENGLLTGGSENRFSAGVVTAKIGDRTATARVRIAPTLPFTEDFESHAVGSIPPGFIGAKMKTSIVERDGSKVFKKLAEKPSVPFMRIRVYAGPPIDGGYTVQADMLGTPKKRRFIPEMGLINSRYRMYLHGNPREPLLRLVSWSPIPRVQKDIDFEWKTETWYRMKFSVEVQGSQALVRGKVWERDKKEPEAWTIELVDPFPNYSGSPGLYGYSPGTTAKSRGPEIFYDNFQVMPNETAKD